MQIVMIFTFMCKSIQKVFCILDVDCKYYILKKQAGLVPCMMLTSFATNTYFHYTV